MAKPTKTFRVYGTDSDGSERLMATVAAKSPAHAVLVAASIVGHTIRDACPELCA